MPIIIHENVMTMKLIICATNHSDNIGNRLIVGQKA